MFSMQDLRLINRAERFIVTQHGRERLVERGIALADVMNTINSGEIIEQYPDDFPFPSALVLGQTNGSSALHVVVALNEEFIYLISAYFPDTGIWNPDMKTRKGVK